MTMQQPPAQVGASHRAGGKKEDHRLQITVVVAQFVDALARIADVVSVLLKR